MRILVIRHAEPDYEHDSLTEKGDREAMFLATELAKRKIDRIYCSPLGRARRTAGFTLEKTGLEADVRPWLHEFRGKSRRPDRDSIGCSWDWLPSDWTKEPDFYDKDKWVKVPAFEGTNMASEFEIVKNGIDSLLAENGYVREGGFYRAVRPNEDTLAIFCHLAVEAVFVSYMVGISPFVMLHSFAPAPSSVTTLVTEERIPGVAAFRILEFGSTSHLYINNEEPSFAARFCEMFDNLDQRH